MVGYICFLILVNIAVIWSLDHLWSLTRNPGGWRSLILPNIWIFFNLVHLPTWLGLYCESIWVVHKLRHHLFSFRMCEATLYINVRISRLTKKYKERRKKKSRGSWKGPDGCFNSPTAFVANQKSFQWIVGKVKCSDSIYLFWKDIWWGSVWSEKEKTWPKKFQFLKHYIQGGMLIQERAPKHVLLCDTRGGNLPII